MNIYETKSYYNQGAAERSPHVLFVFGDNQERVGMGGQAIIRYAGNAVGIATKRSCGECMTGTLADFEAVLRDIRNLEVMMKTRDVLFPVDEHGCISIGCGLADLPTKAPALYAMISDWFESLPGKRRVRLK